jgi:hypothetical protein
MTLLGLILSVLFVPSIQEKSRVIGSDQPWKLCTVIGMFNPLRIFRQFVYPNVFLAVRSPSIPISWDVSVLIKNSASPVVFSRRFNTLF